MADLVAVRHKTQDASEDPGMMPREYFEVYGKDKGYVRVDETPPSDPAEQPPPSGTTPSRKA